MWNKLPAARNKTIRPRRIRPGLVIALMAGWFWLAFSARLQAASFTASLDRDAISMGETATITLTFEGGSPSEMPELPNVPGLSIQDEHNDSTSISFVNGEMSSTASHTFSVTPMK